MTNDLEVMRESAINFAENGLSVFPVQYILDNGQCSCRKPCDSPGKHPVMFLAKDAFKSGTTDVEQIADWWRKWPWNIGLWCKGFIVLDVDGEAGSQSLAKLTQEHGTDWLNTRTVKTGSGGWHYYFRLPDGVASDQRAAFMPGLDTRNINGYTILPPSNHASGGFYEWERFNPINEPPEWFISLLEVKQQVVTATTVIPDGTRNISLYKIACAMRGTKGPYGVYLSSPDVIYAALKQINRLYVSPPKPEEEIVKIVKSAIRRPTAEQKAGESRSKIDELFKVT